MSTIAIVLDNFRLMHVEQFDALADAVAGRHDVVGLELFSDNRMYAFGRHRGARFEHVTLFDDAERERLGQFRAARTIVARCLEHRAKIVLISHYERHYIFLASIVLRLLGRRLYVITDSKFDDYPRHLWREALKWIRYLPYHGAIVASPRSADYLRLLGIPARRIMLGAYTTAIERVRRDAGSPPAPAGVPFGERYFLCIARLVDKKNHAMLLEAYARYRAGADRPRRLVLCGTGPLEGALRAQAAALGLVDHVTFAGNVPAGEVARHLAHGLCLLLTSIEEQFGIVVLEAQAMGLPVLLTIQCGARDRQVRSGVNGFVVEDDNAAGLAWFMARLGEDEPLWRTMADGARAAAEQADVGSFVAAVRRLVDAGASPALAEPAHRQPSAPDM